MEPRIQYAKTTDGVNITYGDTGESTPLLLIPSWPLSHVQRDWQGQGLLPTFRSLARRFRLVLDVRGSGLSEGDLTGFSLESYFST